MEIAPFDPERCAPHARVYEDDVHGVLAADPGPRPVEASLASLERAARADRGHPPGSVVACPGRPLRLRAIVHDLDREPSWREEWIATATAAALEAAWRRGLTRLALPLLGTVHGRLPRARALALLDDALASAAGYIPETLWLVGAAPAEIRELRRRVLDR